MAVILFITGTRCNGCFKHQLCKKRTSDNLITYRNINLKQKTYNSFPAIIRPISCVLRAFYVQWKHIMSNPRCKRHNSFPWVTHGIFPKLHLFLCVTHEYSYLLLYTSVSSRFTKFADSPSPKLSTAHALTRCANMDQRFGAFTTYIHADYLM